MTNETNNHEVALKNTTDLVPTDQGNERKTRKQQRQEKAKQSKTDKESGEGLQNQQGQEKSEKKRKFKGTHRIFPIWLRLIVVFILIVLASILGLIVGYSILGDGEPLDVLSFELWQRVIDIITGVE